MSGFQEGLICQMTVAVEGSALTPWVPHCMPKSYRQCTLAMRPEWFLITKQKKTAFENKRKNSENIQMYLLTWEVHSCLVLHIVSLWCHLIDCMANPKRHLRLSFDSRLEFYFLQCLPSVLCLILKELFDIFGNILYCKSNKRRSIPLLC